MGERLRKCDADGVGEDLGGELSAAARQVVGPLLKSVESLSQQIDEYDSQIAEIAKRYEKVELLRQVDGVGTLTRLLSPIRHRGAEARPAFSYHLIADC